MTNVAGTNQTLAYKVLQDHLLAGKLAVGERITIRIDQTLTQDSTGTMVYLQLEAMDIGKVATDLSVAYIDHNTLQTGFENADDHAFIESVAARHNVIFSKPGGGICHQLHLENYGIPGKTLLGSDSHTPTGGGLGMLAIGAGGLDVAIAMAQGSYSLTVPKVIGVRLTGRLRPWVSAKDVILEVLRQLSVKGGVGAIIEYCGNGVATLSVTDRATITNMGAELGATTSIFPSDENTRIFLAQEGREEVWVPLTADADAVYDEMLEIDLSTLAPMAAKPHSPDNVEAISTIGPLKVDQVAIGSCTNASYSDLMKVAAILRGQRVHPKVSLVIAPGSAAILAELARNGALSDMIAAGARVIECACGPCIGMGQSPKSGAVSLRTFNRNFKGRSGTSDADVYLVSPETAAISAITGVLTEGLAEHGGLGIDLDLDKIPTLTADFASAYASFVEQPPALTDSDELPALVMGPNIKPFPRGRAVPTGSDIKGSVVLVAGDNITTDDIMPSDSRLLPYRSNIPHLAEYCFEKIDPEFPAKAKAAQGSNIAGAAIIGGDNYGQGSSREHAALVPLYLGIRMVLAKSFARIHRANLINNGILPLVFADPEDAEAIKAGDVLVFPDAHAQLGGASAGDAPAVAATGDASGDIAATGAAAASTSATSPGFLTVQNLTGSAEYKLLNDLSSEERQVLLAGGRINAIRGEN